MAFKNGISDAATLVADVVVIDTNVDTLLTDVAVIDGYTEKIDDAAADGLAGTEDSAAYATGEVDRHVHHWERWFETAAVADGEVHVADRLGEGAGAFQIDAGNDTWGAWVQILGSSDTPADAGKVKYDSHLIAVEAAERNATYFVQIAYGTSGAAALAADTYTESMFTPASNVIDTGPINIAARRVAVTTKAWARCMCPGQDTATIDFFHGLHEYEG